MVSTSCNAFVYKCDVTADLIMTSFADDEPLGDIEEELQVLIEVDVEPTEEELLFEADDAEEHDDEMRPKKLVAQKISPPSICLPYSLV